MKKQLLAFACAASAACPIGAKVINDGFATSALHYQNTTLVCSVSSTTGPSSCGGYGIDAEAYVDLISDNEGYLSTIPLFGDQSDPEPDLYYLEWDAQARYTFTTDRDTYLNFAGIVGDVYPFTGILAGPSGSSYVNDPEGDIAPDKVYPTKGEYQLSADVKGFGYAGYYKLTAGTYTIDPGLASLSFVLDDGGSNDSTYSLAFSISDKPFSSGSAVPEPASWAMAIIGLGIVGITLRRRTATSRYA